MAEDHMSAHGTIKLFGGTGCPDLAEAAGVSSSHLAARRLCVGGDNLHYPVRSRNSAELWVPKTGITP